MTKFQPYKSCTCLDCRRSATPGYNRYWKRTAHRKFRHLWKQYGYHGPVSGEMRA